MLWKEVVVVLHSAHTLFTMLQPAIAADSLLVRVKYVPVSRQYQGGHLTTVERLFEKQTKRNQMWHQPSGSREFRVTDWVPWMRSGSLGSSFQAMRMNVQLSTCVCCSVDDRDSVLKGGRRVQVFRFNFMLYGHPITIMMGMQMLCQLWLINLDCLVAMCAPIICLSAANKRTRTLTD